ncbi:MAG: MraY family glycosyltransferase [Candidatus Paceibacterota bacterium]
MQDLILYLKPLLLSFFLSIVFVKTVISLSKKYDLFDKNDGRRKHDGRISRLGGLGIIVAFWSAIFLSGSLVFDGLKIGLIVCSVLIFIFGFWDDIKELSWKKQMVFQVIIALIMIYAGLSVDYIANPFGGREFRLDSFSFMDFSVLGSLFVILWIVGFMNVVNWLDGMDGLAGGVGVIGAFTIFLLSTSDLVNQPPLAVMAIALVGALLGFLFFNFHPAKIFMGSSGALFLGFILAVLAIFSGGKIATVFLVMGFPILDACWVIYKRLRAGKSPFLGDRGHFHYQLLEQGWSDREAVLFIYFLSAVFGLSALAFQGIYKFVAIVVLFITVPVLITRVKYGKIHSRKIDKSR